MTAFITSMTLPLFTKHNVSDLDRLGYKAQKVAGRSSVRARASPSDDWKIRSTQMFFESGKDKAAKGEGPVSPTIH